MFEYNLVLPAACCWPLLAAVDINRRQEDRPGPPADMARSNLNEEAAIIMLMSSF